jgi:single-strand DNA-binding protein
MKNYSIKGTLYDVSKVNNISDRFRKREFVIAIEEKGRDQSWVNYVRLQLENKDVLMIDQFHIGNEIEVTFDIKGSKAEKMGETLFFTNLKAWKIELVDGDIETRDYPQQEGRQSREAVNYSSPDDLEPSDKAPWE